ncbi:MAG: 3,5-nucleoside bisphosphate phosphatase [Verrucomicrobiota bacterium]|jgi:PHP family Zn ribbon phosphoesterase|nr:3,5-nucleoside bisphosphate phosphatase [Verrucomicrobiota bacterium]MDK2962842.1 3,5-nucleoside bisphosphate phosphatase [Verrucomicrobiota bacterium]
MKARIDFHIHSCLSPCASLDMAPRTIVARAKAAGIDCLALTDHSCTENLPAFHDACVEIGIDCLYGLEASSAEEVHVLCLFDDLEQAMTFGSMVYNHLPDRPVDPKLFGDQPVVTVDEEILRLVPRLLNTGTDISFFDLVPMALDAGALCIPSHIDRETCGAVSHLGFLPDLPYDAVEVVGTIDSDIARRWPVVRFSDSHYPEQIACRFTEIETESFTVPALRAAFNDLLLK